MIPEFDEFNPEATGVLKIVMTVEAPDPFPPEEGEPDMMTVVYEDFPA